MLDLLQAVQDYSAYGYQTGAFGEIKITLKNGKCYTVDFGKVDGRLSI